MRTLCLLMIIPDVNISLLKLCRYTVYENEDITSIESLNAVDFDNLQIIYAS